MQANGRCESGRFAPRRCAAIAGQAIILWAVLAVPPWKRLLPLAPDSVRTQTANDLSAVSPDVLSDRTVPSGGRCETTIPLRNHASSAVLLRRVETSCPCLTAIAFPGLLPPEATDKATLGLDLTAEPDFRGRLSIRVTGYDENDRVAFETEVRFDVRPGGDPAFVMRHGRVSQ